MSHPKTSKRHLTDIDLATRSIQWLWDLAEDCEIEPADPVVCDACAAYVVAQSKQNYVRDDAAKELMDVVSEFQPNSAETLRYWLRLGRNASGINQSTGGGEWDQGWNALLSQLINL